MSFPRFILATIFLFSLSLSARAQDKKAIIFGGNCNEKAQVTQKLMIGDMRDNAKKLKKKNWDTEVLQGASREDLITSLSKSINDLKANDQLMLTLQTHGRQEIQGKAHEICMKDGKAMAIDDKDFLKVLEQAKSKGVRVGILNDACYGGAAVEKLSQYSCVLSTQSKFSPATGRASAKTLQKFNQDSSLSFAHLPAGYQMGVTSEMSRTLERSNETNLGDVYLSTLINYNSELASTIKEDESFPGNFPQFSGHIYGNRRIEDISSLLGNYQHLEAMDILEIDQQMTLVPKSMDSVGNKCSYLELSQEASTLMSFLKNSSDETLFKEMMSKYAGIHAPQYQNLGQFLREYQAALSAQLELAKNLDAAKKRSSEVFDQLFNARSEPEKALLRETKAKIGDEIRELQKRLKPLAKKMIINFNLLKALDFYSQAGSNPCSSYGL